MWGPLYAEVGDGTTLTLMGLMGAFGMAVQWVAGKFWEWRQARRKERQDDAERADERKATKEKTITQHLETVNARITAELVEVRREAGVTRERLTQFIAHVRYLEGLMEGKGVKFSPLSPDLYQSAGLGTDEFQSLDTKGGT